MDRTEKPAARLPFDERGVTTVEYAIMLILVALAVAAFGVGINGAVTAVFDQLINFLAP